MKYGRTVHGVAFPLPTKPWLVLMSRVFDGKVFQLYKGQLGGSAGQVPVEVARYEQGTRPRTFLCVYPMAGQRPTLSIREGGPCRNIKKSSSERR